MKIGCRETSDFFYLFLFYQKMPFSFCVLGIFVYLCPMKTNIDWKKAIVFLIVIGGLIYITKVELGMTSTNSFLTTLGVLLVLFVGDHFAQQIDEWLKRKERMKNLQDD